MRQSAIAPKGKNLAHLLPREGKFFGYFNEHIGIPVSTAHTITGAIVAVGAVQKLSAVRWGVAQNIVLAWALTIPCSAFLAALVWWLARLFLG